MSIQNLYDKTAVVKRLSDLGNGTQGYITVLDGVGCCMQPLDDAYTEDISGNFGKDSMLFTDVADILEGDIMIIDGINYKIVGAESFNFLGVDRHMELRIRRANDETNTGQ